MYKCSRFSNVEYRYKIDIPSIIKNSPFLSVAKDDHAAWVFRITFANKPNAVLIKKILLQGTIRELLPSLDQQSDVPGHALGKMLLIGK